MRVDLINTRHGTYNSFEFSHGNCLPLTGAPFGMNYFTVQNDNDPWFFSSESKYFDGIRLTHQPSPWMGDFCSILLSPFVNENNTPRRLIYNSEKSIFRPHCLSIVSDNNGLKCTLTPSMYGAAMTVSSSNLKKGVRISFPISGKMTEYTSKEIRGYAEQENEKYSYPVRLFFVIQVDNDVHIEIQENEAVLFLDSPEELTLRIGTSFINFEMAKRNIPVDTVQKIFNDAARLWNDKLDKIEICDTDENKVKTFYHNLYRVFLFPQTFYELKNDKPIHYDMYSNKIKEGYLYMNNGFWDTSKTVYSLFSIIETVELEKILSGILCSYHESGFLPKWLAPEEKGAMPGTLVDSIIAECAVKGFSSDLMQELLGAMIHSAEIKSDKEDYGRIYIDEYKQLGYVSNIHGESVSHTLDYCYSDFCISQTAKILGKKEIQEKYQKRSKNYTNVFNPKRKLMVAKDENGTFEKSFNPIRWGGAYAEANSLQNSFAVPHDIGGLVTLYDSKEQFEKLLISISNTSPDFETGSYKEIIHEMAEMEDIDFGQINIGNQPSFHLPYLFHFIGKPYYCQPMLKQMMSKLFNSSSSGYPGDEDNGSMASWFILNSLGMYPFCPATGEYLIGMPLFDKVKVNLAKGKILEIKTSRNKEQHQFLNEVTYNGQRMKRSYFLYKELIAGGKIEYDLGCVPNPYCFYQDMLPYSLSSTKVNDS